VPVLASEPCRPRTGDTSRRYCDLRASDPTVIGRIQASVPADDLDGAVVAEVLAEDDQVRLRRVQR
jgi:hypothetical protein